MRYSATKLKTQLKPSNLAHSQVVDYKLNLRVFSKLQLTRTDFEVKPNDEVVTHTPLHHCVRGIGAVTSQCSSIER